MKEIHSRFVAEVRKGRSPEAAAQGVGVPPEKAQRWMQKRSIREAIEAPADASVKTPQRVTRKRAASKRKK